ncbi:hypothetical protein E2C01_032507 [Portunus trituberculatus]|uniref:Uncharacterized protein n=1 Tax=Portunus trituberculatus TaxID=210409 RepID=A0A5B7F145_PORTR|nr:hypothetical protein [Portunus trituberculatus]
MLTAIHYVLLAYASSTSQYASLIMIEPAHYTSDGRQSIVSIFHRFSRHLSPIRHPQDRHSFHKYSPAPNGVAAPNHRKPLMSKTSSSTVYAEGEQNDPRPHGKTLNVVWVANITKVSAARPHSELAASAVISVTASAYTLSRDAALSGRG